MAMRYLGQCDRLRRASGGNDRMWQAMMRRAEPASFGEFLAHVDMTELLDEGETPREYLKNAVRSDPRTGVYRSWWGAEPAWFLQTAGFEFIFV